MNRLTKYSDECRDCYGSGSKWTDIYSANKGTIGANPNKIYPGQVFTIP